MDKQYIKMCIGAFGDIGYIKPSANLPNLMVFKGSWIIGQEDKEFAINLTWQEKFEDIFKNTTIPDPLGQLYRQDQLQEMVIKNDLGELVYKWECFIDSQYRNRGLLVASPLFEFKTMEQLWLAFVMKEKYGKVWAEDNWSP